jgi:hypothetical protein
MSKTFGIVNLVVGTVVLIVVFAFLGNLTARVDKLENHHDDHGIHQEVVPNAPAPGLAKKVTPF